MLPFAVPAALLLAAATPAPAARADSIVGDTVEFTSGALRLRGVLWRPTAGGRRPAVLLLHGSGGCFDGGDANYRVGRVFAERGYVAFLGCRRGQGLSEGRGTSVRDQIGRLENQTDTAAFFDKMTRLLETEQLDDVEAALAYLRARPEVDTARVAVVGMSFGGILTLLAAERGTGVRAAVAFAPGAMNWRQNAPLKARMLRAARGARVPVLVVQAENDFDLGPSREIPAAMRDAHRPGDVRVYPAITGPIGRPNAGHALMVLAPDVWSADVFAFLDRSLR